MNILLASARRSLYTGEWITAPHQGLLSLAAVLREGTFHETEGVHVEVMDDQLELLKNPTAPFGSWLSERYPDILGVHTTTSSLKSGIRLLSEARLRVPGILTVLGGTGVTPKADELIRNGAADVVVRGEGDETFSHLVSVYAHHGRQGFPEVLGITYMDDEGRVVSNKNRAPIGPLDKLPLPARDLVDMSAYRKISHGRAGNLITSRGCSYACAYCYSKHQWGVGQRRFSVARILTEVEALLQTYGIDRIRIEDDDFLEDRAWVTEFCQELIERNLQIEWEAKARPDHMDDDILRLMKRSGCFRLLVGVETLDPSLLSRMRRPLSVETTERALTLMSENGIGVQATMILGIPGETDKAMRSTISWLENRLKGEHDISSPCFFVPFYDEITRAMSQRLEFTIVERDTDRYTGHLPVTSSPACSFEELLALYDDMQPTRRGIYERIAHLAPLAEVNQRLSAEG